MNILSGIRIKYAPTPKILVFNFEIKFNCRLIINKNFIGQYFRWVINNYQIYTIFIKYPRNSILNIEFSPVYLLSPLNISQFFCCTLIFDNGLPNSCIFLF